MESEWLAPRARTLRTRRCGPPREGGLAVAKRGDVSLAAANHVACRGLVEGPHHDLVHVHVPRARHGPADAFRHVVGGERGHTRFRARASFLSPRKRTRLNSVSTSPGSISVTRIGRPKSSNRRVLVSARTACLAPV